MALEVEQTLASDLAQALSKGCVMFKQNQDLARIIQELSAKHNASKTENAKLKKELQDERENTATANKRQEMKALRDRCDQLEQFRDNRDELRDERDKLKNDVNLLQSRGDKITKELRDVTFSSDRLKQDYQRLASAYNQLQRDYDQSLYNNNAQGAEYQELMDAHNRLWEGNDKLEGECARLEQRLRGVDQASDVTEADNTHPEQVTLLECEYAMLLNEHLQLRDDHKRFKEQLFEVQQERTELQSAVAYLREELDSTIHFIKASNLQPVAARSVTNSSSPASSYSSMSQEDMVPTQNVCFNILEHDHDHDFDEFIG